MAATLMMKAYQLAGHLGHIFEAPPEPFDRFPSET
jgi:hypothetical protein